MADRSVTERSVHGSVVLVKLGGSLITDKRRPSTARRAVVARLAGEIASAFRAGGPRVVLGHGSGSFGHLTAKRYGLTRPVSTPRQVAGLAATRLAAMRLHRLVLESLREAGLKPFSWAPSSAMVLDDGVPVSVAVEPIARALDLGLLPVLFGDVVVDRTRGAAICSTESAFVAVARALVESGRQIDGALWLGETAGVLDEDGATIDRIDEQNAAAILSRLHGASGPDVTGGMRHRVETAWHLAAVGIASSIFDGRDAGSLRRALCGGARERAGLGTLVSGS